MIALLLMPPLLAAVVAALVRPYRPWVGWVSVLAAVDQLAFSGGANLDQTRAILHRGFAGDWVITPRHVAREATPEPLPEPPPPAAGGEHRGFEPPPI